MILIQIKCANISYNSSAHRLFETAKQDTLSLEKTCGRSLSSLLYIAMALLWRKYKQLLTSNKSSIIYLWPLVSWYATLKLRLWHVNDTNLQQYKVHKPSQK